MVQTSKHYIGKKISNTTMLTIILELIHQNCHFSDSLHPLAFLPNL